MKNKFNLLLLLAVTVLSLGSCNKDEIPVESTPAFSYFINYGSYSGAKSTITAFNTEEDTVSNNYYKAINRVDMISNVQYAYNFNNSIYFLGNNADQIFFVDNKTFEQTHNGIDNDIIKPRYCVGQGDYLYVSCWGGNIWEDNTLSYIAKVNVTTNTVESKIELHGGPEGLAIINNRLFAALNYKDSVAVIDLSNDAISYIETPTTSSYFLKDNNDNLYVSFVSYNPGAQTGLGYINTSTDVLEATYELTGISSSYVNIMAANTDFSKIYVMKSAYDANWNLTGAIAVFDVASKSFENNVVEGVSGINGVACNDGKVFCFISEGATLNGRVQSYHPDGTFVKEYETGIAPFMLLTVE